MKLTYTTVADSEFEGLGQNTAHAFATTPERSTGWLQKYAEEVRAIRKNGVVAGSLLRVPMGQFFGGASVPMCGIAGVVMHGAERGQGLATHMMSAAVREMRRDGFALSALFASTAKLYRRSGWESAGVLCETTLPTRELPRNTTMPARAVEATDEVAIRKLYRSFASKRDGHLDRGPYIWPRTRQEVEGRPVYGMLIGAEGRPEGYLFYRLQPRTAPPGYEVVVTDYAFTSAAAAARLLGLLAEHRTLSTTIRTVIPLDSPLLSLLPGHHFQTEVKEAWMLRVLDVVSAIEQRGYPKSLVARFTIKIRDEVVRANHRCFSVVITNGSATVRKGTPRQTKQPQLTMDVGTFASVYSGHQNPVTLGTVGKIAGSTAALEKLAFAFHGTPRLVDFF